MKCRTIGDVLRSVLASYGGASSEISAPEPPATPVSPWLDPARIRASTACDVVQRRDDDRSRAERRAQSSEALAVARLSRPPKFNFGARVKAKATSARPKADMRDYMRRYMRERRARSRDNQAREPAEEVRHGD
jgi:hypothetical protein